MRLKTRLYGISPQMCDDKWHSMIEWRKFQLRSTFISVKAPDIVVHGFRPESDNFDSEHKPFFNDYLTEQDSLSLDIVYWLFEAQTNSTAIENFLRGATVKFSLDSCKTPRDFYMLGYCGHNCLQAGGSLPSEADLYHLTLGYKAGCSNGTSIVALSKGRTGDSILQSLWTVFSFKCAEIVDMDANDLDALSNIMPTTQCPEALKVYRSFGVDIQDVLKLVSISTNLEYLDLSLFPFTSSSVTCLATILSQNQPRLSGLYLQGCEINTHSAVELSRSLSDASSLTLLDLSDNEIGNEGVLSLAKKISEGSMQLLDLRLSACGIDEDGAVCLVEALHSTERPTISKLDLSHNPLTNKSAAVFTHIAKLLEHTSTSLTDLKLVHNTYPSLSNSLMLVDEQVLHTNYIRGCAQLAQALCNSTTLKELDLSWNKVNMDTLATILQHNSSLTYLKLLDCDIQIRNLEQLLEYVCSNKKSKLKVLNLRRNPITTDVSQGFVQSLRPRALLVLLYDTISNDLECLLSTTEEHTLVWRNQTFEGKSSSKVSVAQFKPE